MTTSPTEPPESTLAAVVAYHRLRTPVAGGREFGCACGEWTAKWAVGMEEHPFHVAAAILAATPTAVRIAQLEADLAAAEAKLAAVEALASEWEATVYKLPPGYPMTVNEFCRYWFKAPTRAALATQPAP